MKTHAATNQSLIFNIKSLKSKHGYKISHGRRISLGNKLKAWIELNSSDLLKLLPTFLENNEQIASLNSYTKVLTEPVTLPGGVLLPSRWPQWTFHTLHLAQTDVPLQEQHIYGTCAPRRSFLLCQLPLLTYSGVPHQKYQQTCNHKPNSYHH